MNFKKLTSLVLSALMTLGTFAAIPKASAENVSAETVSESTLSETEKNKLTEEIREKIEKNDDLKKEAEELKKELSECKGENKASKLKSVTLKVLKFIGKFVIGGIGTAGAMVAFLALDCPVSHSFFRAVYPYLGGGCGWCRMMTLLDYSFISGGLLTAILL